MSSKISAEHLGRGAVIYIRQSTLSQAVDHKESQRRQYALVEAARTMGFEKTAIIDADIGRSGSGLVERPGFASLTSMVIEGRVGAVFCIEASRLARNGRDWHLLIDLCALTGTLLIDGEGTYDPRLSNDRLLLGLKGSMVEYELTLMRQRGLAARDEKARRGELKFKLPPGYVWNDLDKIEIDPDERIADAIRLLFAKFQELGSARQLALWTRTRSVEFPISGGKATEGNCLSTARFSGFSGIRSTRAPMPLVERDPGRPSLTGEQERASRVADPAATGRS